MNCERWDRSDESPRVSIIAVTIRRILMRTRNIAGVVATALIFGSAAVLADEHEHEASANQLGKVSFPTSCDP